MELTDQWQRPLRNLRLSVTDRCNLRCLYCMPEEDYTWLPKGGILRFAEIVRLVRCFGEFGVTKVRLTGGEPLLRKDLPLLVDQLAHLSFLRELALTTNGLLLADFAPALRDAGLDRVTVSLDTLRPDRFEKIARRDGLERTLRGIEAAHRAGFAGTKIDTVVIKGVNDDELVDLIRFGQSQGVEVRFIEYMDVGGATGWSVDQVVSRADILAQLSAEFGVITPIAPVSEEDRAAPANRYRLPDGTPFGIIASTTSPFCGDCDRSRVTADGTWYLCLYARLGIDLKTPLRQNSDDAAIKAAIERGWGYRDDRGAQDRLELEHRERLADIAELRDDPRLEMHTRGG